MGEIWADKNQPVGLNLVRQMWGFSLAFKVRHRKRWTRTPVSHSRVRHNRLLGQISGYKMCLGDPKGGNVTGVLKNSLHADFRAMHRQVTSRTSYHTV